MEEQLMDVVTPRCPTCGAVSVLKVNMAGYRAWKAGELIQNALPDMPKETREMLMTGMHPACWDRVFSRDRQEEGRFAEE